MAACVSRFISPPRRSGRYALAAAHLPGQRADEGELKAGFNLSISRLCYGQAIKHSGLTMSAGLVSDFASPSLSSVEGIVLMPFACVHKKISLSASIVAICAAVLVTIGCLQVGLSIYRSKIDGDTPEICRLYLEQNAFVHDHFGRLHEESFIRDESATFTQDPPSGTKVFIPSRLQGPRAPGS
jgi:hypothetical protein